MFAVKIWYSVKALKRELTNLVSSLFKYCTNPQPLSCTSYISARIVYSHGINANGFFKTAFVTVVGYGFFLRWVIGSFRHHDSSFVPWDYLRFQSMQGAQKCAWRENKKRPRRSGFVLEENKNPLEREVRLSTAFAVFIGWYVAALLMPFVKVEKS